MHKLGTLDRCHTKHDGNTTVQPPAVGIIRKPCDNIFGSATQTGDGDAVGNSPIRSEAETAVRIGLYPDPGKIWFAKMITRQKGSNFCVVKLGILYYIHYRYSLPLAAW